ncbi:MAG: protein-glutamate O-methyltransferase CheR [Gammaproteobacteria bacterium]|nr:protein-glutamate O-methyltransferase CheR [Gammaproteobacteria bacterium]
MLGVAPADEFSDREFRFTERDFNFLRDLVGARAGIALNDNKRQLVYSRLVRRLRELGLKAFSDYCAILKQDEDEELGHMINAITTNLTSFFREPHHFEYLADILKRLKQSQQRRIRIWSAGCSTGEEPYTIAMVVREVMGAAVGWDIKILASDLDTKVLATAEQGIYDHKRVEGISSKRLSRWFRKGSGENVGKVRVARSLRDLVAFRQLNLMDNPWPMRGPFDIIFCRNVVIYFNKDTQRELFKRMDSMLSADGRLLVGHSESLFKVSDRFKLCGKTTYRKCA